jgi:hypothetical protein
MDRPQGVSIIAAVAWIAGVINVVVGFGYLFTFFLPYAQLTDQPSAIGLLIVGGIWLAIGYGFWSAAPWARTFGLLWAGISILAGVWVLIVHLNTFSDVLLPVLSSILLPLVIFWYLRQDRVKDFFEVEGASGSELRRS